MTRSISITQSTGISKFLRAGGGIVPSSNQAWPWQFFLLLKTSPGCKMQPCCGHFQPYLRCNHDDFMLTRLPSGGKHQQQQLTAPLGRRLGSSSGSREEVGRWRWPGTEPSPVATALPRDPPRLRTGLKLLPVATLETQSPNLVVVNKEGKYCHCINQEIIFFNRASSFFES